MRKRFLAILTSICMIIAMTPMGMAFAEEGNPTGRLGDNVFWELDKGTLSVTGTGEIEDFSRVGTTDSYGRDFEPYINDIHEIYMGSGITRIGDNAFRGLGYLADLTISDTVESIGNNAFYGDHMLYEIVIPDSVKQLEGGVFGYCSLVKKLSVGKGLNSIGKEAFEEMRALESISVSDANECFSVFDNILYDKNKTRVIFCPSTHSSKVTLPDSVEVIGERAFEGCSDIPEIELNEGLKCIEYKGLEFCNGLKSITLPESLEEIGEEAFYLSSGLKKITIPANVTTIRSNAFRNLNGLKLYFKGKVPDFLPSSTGEYYIVGTGSSVDIYHDCSSKEEGWTEEAFEKFNHETIRLLVNHNLKEESLAPTCTETGLISSYVCADCGNRYADEDCLELIEDYEAWKKDEANIIPANGHEYGVWHMAKCPTCVKEGKICRICDVCFGVEYRSAERLSHEIVKVEAGEPTCKKEGVIEHWICSECGTHFADAEGNVCLEDNSWVIPKKDHVVEITPAKAATCTEDGLTEGKACKDCGSVILEQRIIPATGHSFDSSSVTTKATFGKNGVLTFKCSECSATNTKSIPAIDSCVLDGSSFTYTGKTIKPEAIAENINGVLISDSSYSISYSDNTKCGKATAKVKFSGKYTGTKSLTFKILPKKPTISSLTSGKKKLTVKAKTKVSSTGGTYYQIAYRVKGASDWNYTTTKNSSKTIKSLKKGKTYQVKLRAYRTVDGKKYKGEWSSVKTSKKIK